MSNIFHLRLSPSGPPVEDDGSGEGLLVGPGTPGLVWYYSGDSTEPSCAAAQVSPGSLGATDCLCNATVGKSYRINGAITVSGIGADGSVAVRLFGVPAAGGAAEELTWLPNANVATPIMGIITLPVVTAEDQLVTIPIAVTIRPTKAYSAIYPTVIGVTGAVVESSACHLEITEYVT